MICRLTYDIGQLTPYINWPYFDHAWGVSNCGDEERSKLRREAIEQLQALDGKYQATALFGLFRANGDEDDLLLWPDEVPLSSPAVRLPMLRQQRPAAVGAPCLCLADFVRPLSAGETDTVGVFATTVDHHLTADCDDDPYSKMMAQTLADRLAEAAAEVMHMEVRRHYWGYAPDEQLTIQQLHIEAFQGIRPAVGYPSLPDNSLNFILYDLIGMKQIGIRLTESGMMVPHASVSGLMLAHPQARYFDVGRIGDDQLRDYSRRRGVPVEVARRFLANHLSST